MANATSTTPKTPKRTPAKKPAAAKKPSAANKGNSAPAMLTESNTAKAKSRFNAALEEARAGGIRNTSLTSS